MAGCPTKVQLDDGEILSCVRQEHPEEPNDHRDWMVEFRKVEDGVWAVQRWQLDVEEI
jgi:hypothetical protein